MRRNGVWNKVGGICVTHWLYKSVCIGILLLGGYAHANNDISDQRVAIQLLENAEHITFQSDVAIELSDDDQKMVLEAGVYSFNLKTVKAATDRFHLFSKTFQLDESKEEKAYLKSLKKQGYTPLSMVKGKQLKTGTGRVLDARVHWISIVQTSTEAQALEKQKQLNEAGQWTWMRQEVTQAGTGTVQLTGASGTQALRLPVKISSASPLVVANVEVGFWDSNKQRLAYGGDLEVTVTSEGKLELLEHIGVEEYLQGVLPSEMPSLWPMEALKAQAVAARSDVLVNLSTKHSLELFDFCNTEHCRAYRGRTLRQSSTDEALVQTQGEILVHGTSIAEALFSANCGGWTENNDTVWFGPPNGALRARPDLLSPMAPPFESEGKFRVWLSQAPAAYCDGDASYFRWTRSFSESELLALVQKKYEIAQLKQIELGERGAGGRLKWIRIHHNGEAVLVKKELPIRQALGGLPSAMFDLAVSGTIPSRTFTLHGAGRGHGVGMCQHGANGMAKRGYTYHNILHHYFSDVTIEKVQ